MIKGILKNKYVMLGVALVIGIAIGAIFYPSKSITREETAKHEKEIESTRAFALDRIKAIQGEKNQVEKQLKEYKKESNSKLSSLRTENTHLRKKTKERIIKIITPDGTIREETVRESDTEVVSQIVTDIKQEFNEKVTSIENKWKQVHVKRVTSIKEKYEEKLTEKQHIIDTYSKKETIKINERKFGVSLGYTTSDTFFSSITYTVFGPVFLDFHLEADREFTDTSAGAAIGVSF